VDNLYVHPNGNNGIDHVSLEGNVLHLENRGHIFVARDE